MTQPGMAGAARPVTGHDVARLAGVSQPTVSRALRGDKRVSDETRRAIQDAARALGYVPSAAGRSLSTRATRQIAIVAALDNPLYPYLVTPIHDELAEHDYRMVLLAERSADAEWDPRLLDRAVDGVIFTTTRLASMYPYELRKAGVPFVFLNRLNDTVPADSVIADNAGGAGELARLLIAQGFRRIGAVFGPGETSTGRDRERGFRAALEDAGRPLPASRVVHANWSYEQGYAAMQKLLRRKSGAPDAVFCSNDVLAAGAVNAAAALGRSVPGDVAVVGFDDLDIASWPLLQLTTVRTHQTAMARRAAAMLVERLTGVVGEGPQRSEVFPTELVLRRSHLRS